MTGPAAERRVAAFDFDGTLSRRDTLLPFLARVAGRRRLASILASEAPRSVRTRMARSQGAARELAAGPGLHHRDDFKMRVLRRVFVGRDAGEIEELGRHYAEHVVALLRPDTMARLAWHRSEQHELVIVSASLVAYLVPFGAAHGFHHVIAVELAADAHGRLTGELAAPNVRGPEKAVRLRAWLSETVDDRAVDDSAGRIDDSAGRIVDSAGRGVELWAYGDSSGDDELLAMADHPTRVSRPPRQGRAAKRRP
jgi:phosphatidylglycerophosphatase C